MGPGVDSESLVSEEDEEEELDDESVSDDEEDVSDKLLRGGAPAEVNFFVVIAIGDFKREKTYSRFIHVLL